MYKNKSGAVQISFRITIDTLCNSEYIAVSPFCFCLNFKLVEFVSFSSVRSGNYRHFYIGLTFNISSLSSTFTKSPRGFRYDVTKLFRNCTTLTFEPFVHSRRFNPLPLIHHRCLFDLRFSCWPVYYVILK